MDKKNNTKDVFITQTNIYDGALARKDANRQVRKHESSTSTQAHQGRKHAKHVSK